MIRLGDIEPTTHPPHTSGSQSRNAVAKNFTSTIRS
jgi:hypothetical protein